MKLPPFKLEKFFDSWEFKAPHLLCSSDNETLTVKELLEWADPEALSFWENLRLGYIPNSGFPLLKEEISKLYKKIKPHQTLAFAGAGEGIFAAMNAIIRPKDHVIVPFPCYQSLAGIPKELGAEVSFWQIRETETGWEFPLEDLEKLLKPNTRLIVINFPHNPTGAYMDKTALEKIMTYAKRSNAYVFSDEVYAFSEHKSGKESIPLAADLYDKAISLGVMSKSFGLAGIRVGWIATRDKEILDKCLDIKCYLSLCNSAPSEALAIIALRAKQKILARNLDIICKNLDFLDSFFARYPEIFSWKRPLAGSTAFPKLLLPLSIDSFVEDLIAKAGVLLLPGSVYDYPGNYFRLGFGRKDVPEVVTHLERYIHKYVKS